MKQAEASKILEKLSLSIFDSDSQIAHNQFRKSAGYTTYDIDRSAIEEAMMSNGVEVLEALAGSFGELSEEIVGAVINWDSEAITTVKELAWVVGFGGHIFANCHISATADEFIPCPPSVSLVKNIDNRPLTIKRLRLPGSFEDIEKIDVSTAKLETIEPGEYFYIDGFRDLLWYAESGVLLLNLSTLPLGAYEAVYSASSGIRSGLFSSDLRVSATIVALRTYAATGWPDATGLAKQAASHPIKEIRWGALNYYWQTGEDDILENVSAFLDDPDLEIRKLAKSCVEALQSEMTGDRMCA
ncbi:hypothetical protein [Aurantiacibacter sp. D1-12]|uniref:hypothetical protein n=1 Tax=Aurantiacibacter sp. D1-12 TaxID=2993658 RepID=UPI00237C52D8|nr:hypothetical protein [Aurantiacibacter sp. D1-12]MDE1467679.1 hypothetical protein [Aurantiacibacter sp. D1-12]